MQRLQYSRRNKSDCIANQQFQLFCRWILSVTVSQTDSQNTLPSVLTEIKSNLCERAENFSLSEMHSDLCFMRLNKSRHHRIVPEIHIAPFFFRRSNTSLFWWGIYSITLRSSCIHSHYLMWNPCHHTHCGKDMLSKGSLWDILHSRRSLQMYFDEVGLEIQIFQQELWATSHNGWNLFANTVWHLKFHLLWRKKNEENFQ